MSTDREIERAIEAGKKNADGFAMVKNWCAHVRIEKHGGVGMVEAATGLPIGHHGLACDHAPAGGTMTWEIRDAALGFYDRHCRDCTLRQPVGVPNLASWVAERDAAVVKRQAAEAAEANESANKHTDRQRKRAALRTGLPPTAADVVDQIEELDIEGKPELTARLVETARLAPEAFPPAVIEYAFELLEAGERWFDEAGLSVLTTLNSNPPRLARCAMLCLRRWSAIRTAAPVLISRLSVADETLIPAILPTVIRMASPERGLVASRQQPSVVTLVRLNEAFPRQVTDALDTMLDRRPSDVGLVACAVNVLAPRDPALAARFARDLISKFVRAPWMPDPEDYGHDDAAISAQELRDAIVTTFICQADAVDALLQSFRAGASNAGEVRIFSIYGRVLHAGRFHKIRVVGLADRLAFRRLLWEAPKTTNDRILREIQRGISHVPDDLIELARDEVDGLIGAAVLMDQRLIAFDAEQKQTGGTMLDYLERNNKRMTLEAIRKNFVTWAAEGAAAGEKHASYLKVLEGLPEDRDEFAGCMIEHSAVLMDSAAGLNAVLPGLYSALLGASALRRGRAARAVVEIPRRQLDNVPDLLFEAFVTTLADPYIYVHASAVRALDHVRLPPVFDDRIRNILFGILVGHADDPCRQDIVLDCIELLANRYLSDEAKAGQVGAFLVMQLAKMPSWRISSHFRWLVRNLARADGITDLFIACLLDPEATEYSYDDALGALAGLPEDVVYAERAKLASIPPAENRSARYRLFDIIQIVTRSRAWAEAQQLSAAALDAIPDTARERSQRLMFELAKVAAAFENALASGDQEGAAALTQRWYELRDAKEADEREIARTADPF